MSIIQIRSLKAARELAGVASLRVSKIPGSSYSTDSFACHVGSKLAKVVGSTCHKCYARRIQTYRDSAAKGWTSNSAKATSLIAFDPQLCGRIMPLFREDIAGASFITCDDIKASVFRAFNAWGTNSRFFKFTDVTGECEALGLLHGGQEEQPHGGCALAEIWITALTREESRRRQLQGARRRLHTEGGAGSPEGGGLHIESAEQNLDSGGYFVASALSHWRASYSFRYTNGEAAFQWVLTGGEWERRPRPMLETYAGTLAYGVDGGSGGVGLCWYLDSTFCSQFHELKRRMGGPSQARALMCALRLPSLRRHSPYTMALLTPRLPPAWQVRALPAHLPGHAAARLPPPRPVLAGAVRLRHQHSPLQEGEGGGP